MIKITHNGNTKVVTHGAYESFYKPLGYTVVVDKKPEVQKSEPRKFNESDKKQYPKKEVNKERKTNEEK